jgi:hypothetical protein
MEYGCRRGHDSAQFLYLRASKQRVTFNRPALKVCITKVGMRLTLELEID